MRFIRHLVSKQKIRLIAEVNGRSYDLDLSYITPRIIAMGFPAEGYEAIYRNAMDEVASYLNDVHGDKYKVYNLCIEREVSSSKMFGPVVRYPFTDHQAPPMPFVLDFVEDAAAWLQADPDKVVVVHCKAGKGRTGLMICCLLQYLGICGDSQSALKFYATQRTYNKQGVTLPSQQRYSYYYQLLLAQAASFPEVRFEQHVCNVCEVRLHNVPASIARTVILRLVHLAPDGTQSVLLHTKLPLAEGEKRGGSTVVTNEDCVVTLTPSGSIAASLCPCHSVRRGSDSTDASVTVTRSAMSVSRVPSSLQRDRDRDVSIPRVASTISRTASGQSALSTEMIAQCGCQARAAASQLFNMTYHVSSMRPCQVAGELKVELHRKPRVAGSDLLGWTWINPAFLPKTATSTITRSRMDRPSHQLPIDFSLAIVFDTPPPPRTPASPLSARSLPRDLIRAAPRKLGSPTTPVTMCDQSSIPQHFSSLTDTLPFALATDEGTADSASSFFIDAHVGPPVYSYHSARAQPLVKDVRRRRGGVESVASDPLDRLKGLSDLGPVRGIRGGRGSVAESGGSTPSGSSPTSGKARAKWLLSPAGLPLGMVGNRSSSYSRLGGQ